MKIIRISHIGIVPKDKEQAKDFFSRLLQLEYEGSELVAEQKVEVDFFNCENSRLEFLSPTAEDSPIAKFLATKGAGIQHVALQVDDIKVWLDYLKKNEIQLIDEVPRYGAHNAKIAFIHPRSTGGVLVELIEEHHE